jgi:DNA polymerase I-like protein with 3'-5' exonuclease and polymerase domains
MVQAVLLDRRNFDLLAPSILSQIQSCPTKLVGFDIETQDDARHEGLNRLMNIDPVTRKRSGEKGKLVFDHRATVVTGFSLYADEAPNSVYVNLAHADVENRLPWSEARALLDEVRKTGAYFVAHNSSFEMRMMSEALGFEIDKIICTLQLAVSAYGPDECSREAFQGSGLGDMAQLMRQAGKEFRSYDPRAKKAMTPGQAEIFKKVIGKESSSTFSYNGYIKSLSYGYGLKALVKSWFGYEMTTFKQVLGDKAHMGQLTGEEVCAYGADDALWAIKVYHRLLRYMMETNPAVVGTFFSQENPMPAVFSDVARHGMKVNLPAIEQRRTLERTETAVVLRKLKADIKKLLPFPMLPCEGLIKHGEKWYIDGKHLAYRTRLENWTQQFDSSDDYTQVQQISGAVSEGWSKERGRPKSVGPNLSHYMVGRTIICDLMGEKLVMDKGKVQSDANARGKIQDRAEKRTDERSAICVEVLKGMAALASIEQRMKLYLTPYMQLTDPETQHMYPVLSSMLASRRMACQNPNGMQLAKRGDSTYVRGFYEADEPNHVILSQDWSGVELVLIGDQSGDPEFKKAFGQLPYEDMHAGAAADVLAVEVEGLTEELFKKLKRMDYEEIRAISPRLVTNFKGELMKDGGKLVKYWRTEVGKGSNFSYWYSGALSTVGERMGWTSEQMWAATDKYRQRFAVAEAWRVGKIAQAQYDGYVDLPDHHRRVRFECTPLWAELMRDKFGRFGDEGVNNFGREVIRAVKSRANNQIINSLIQGTCATLAKRSIIRMEKEIKSAGFNARFMLPIHDELLYSVHRSEVLDFRKALYDVMCKGHEDIVTTLPLHATAAIGLTFEPFGKNAPVGQIELDEAPDVDWLPKSSWGNALDKDGCEAVLDYLFSNTNKLRMAA